MTLSESNSKIIELLAAGYIQKEIAEQLSMPIATVKDRILEMKRRLSCKTQTQLVVKSLIKNT